jgi:hypothetical protein
MSTLDEIIGAETIPIDLLMQSALRFSEVPPRRSATLTKEPYTRHPARGPEERQPEHISEVLPERPQPRVQPQGQEFRNSAARATADLPTKPPPVRQPETRATQPRRGISPVLIILSILIMGGAGLGSLLVFSRVTPTITVPAQQVGTIAFVSSGQLNENTSQGIDDELQITLHSLNTPASGKSYYAWLLNDAMRTESQPFFIGKLNVVQGSVKLLYPGDAQHTNLLQIGSRFLVTEEDSGVTPLLPSPDTTTWRYYGTIPATPDPQDSHHFSFLNHLRHLLADEPVLDQMELPGGLNSWFARNSQKLIEFTTSARDQWQGTQDLIAIRTEAVSLLAYLDGMSFVVQDLPPASANVQTQIDTHLAGLGLLNVRGASQNPGSYMDQVIYHLNGLLNAPGSPGNVRTIASAVLPVLSSVTAQLQKVRTDDKQLLAMTDTQLTQQSAFALLNDIVVQANNAYAGNTDPATGQFNQGVLWIHQQLQAIGTINLASYIQGSGGTTGASASAALATLPGFLLPLYERWRWLEDLL